VLAGANHTAPSHQLAKEAYTVNRVFVGSGERPANDRVKFVYTAMCRLVRDRQFYPERPAPDALLDRVVLQHMHDKYMPGDHHAAHEAINTMTDGQMSELLLATDAIKRNLWYRSVGISGRKIRQTLEHNASQSGR